MYSNGTMPRVFVSHSHADSWFASRLAKDLRESLLDDDAVVCSYALMKSDPPGSDHSLDDVITREISERTIFVVVLSPAALNSHFVMREVETALQQAQSLRNKIIIGLQYQACDIPRLLKGQPIVSFSSPTEYDDALAELQGVMLDAIGVRQCPSTVLQPFTEVTEAPSTLVISNSGSSLESRMESDFESSSEPSELFQLLSPDVLSRLREHLSNSTIQDHPGRYPREVIVERLDEYLDSLVACAKSDNDNLDQAKVIGSAPIPLSQRQGQLGLKLKEAVVVLVNPPVDSCVGSLSHCKDSVTTDKAFKPLRHQILLLGQLLGQQLEALHQRLQQDRRLKIRQRVMTALVQRIKHYQHAYPSCSLNFSIMGRAAMVGSKQGTSRLSRSKTQHVLAIGIGTYESSHLPDLPVSVRDAQAFYAACANMVGLEQRERSGVFKQVLTNSEASIESVRAALHHLAIQCRSDDVVTIYFAGHGLHEQEQGRLQDYLCLSNTDPHNLSSTALSRDELLETLDRIGSRRLLLVMDTCRSSDVAPNAAGWLRQSMISSALSNDDTVVVACRVSRSPYRHVTSDRSSFRQYLEQAFENSGANNFDDCVTALDLFRYMSEAMQHDGAFEGLGFENP